MSDSEDAPLTRFDIYKEQMGYVLQECDCQLCNPDLHARYGRHLADPSDPTWDYSSGTGLQFHAHDAWVLACHVSYFNTDAQHARPAARAAHVKWMNLLRKFDLQMPRVGVPPPNMPKLLVPSVLSTMVDIFSDLFFLGELPSSILEISWRDFRLRFSTLYGISFPEPSQSGDENVTPVIYLNRNSRMMRQSLAKTVQVILHEMVHVFFNRYACDAIKSDIDCGLGDPDPPDICTRLYRSNMGMSNHGRAWQVAAQSIERYMPKLLRIQGDLGRIDALGEELRRLADFPCHHDIKLLYPWIERLKKSKGLRHYIYKNRERCHKEILEEPRAPKKQRRHSDSEVPSRTRRPWV